MANMIFISYAREDSQFVLQLHDDLKAAGVHVWLDQRDIETGQLWDDAVQESLKACDGLLVVLSHDSMRSQNVKAEYSYALGEDKKIWPVLYRPCEINFRLRPFQYVDFTEDYKAALTKLLDTLTGTGQDEDRQAIAGEGKLKKWRARWSVVGAVITIPLFFLILSQVIPGSDTLSDKDSTTFVQTGSDSLTVGPDTTGDTDPGTGHRSPTKSNPETGQPSGTTTPPTDNGEDTALAQLQSDVLAAKDTMDAAKESVPGDAAEQNQNADFLGAATLEKEGRRYEKADSLEHALKAYQQAATFYAEAAQSIWKNQADGGQALAEQAREDVPSEGHQHEKYQQGTVAEAGGLNAYNDERYADAYDEYHRAQSLFAVVKEAVETARSVVDSLGDAYAEGIKDEGLQALRRLHQSMPSDQESYWQNFFDVPKRGKPGATSDGARVQVTEQRITALMTFHISYRDNKGNPRGFDRAFTWTLEKTGATWKIVDSTK